MSFSDSTPVKIALSNPVDKFGKTFNISNIYLTNSSYQQSVKNVPEYYTLLSNFHQNLDGRDINLRWETTDPRDGHIIKTTEEISKNPYISGFEIAVYQNSGELQGKDVRSDRTKVFETEIKDIAFNYSIPEGTDIRNYSVDIKLNDFAGNQSSGLFTTINFEPDFSITDTSFNDGFYNISYAPLTDDNNNDISNGLQYIDIYNFTGLTAKNEEGSGIFSQEADFIAKNVNYQVGQNGTGEIELSPGDDNYVMVLGVDGFGTGHHRGVYAFRQYVTGEGFSGISGDPEAPRLLRYDPEISSLQSNRISGGDALYFTFDTNYNTGSNLLQTCYGITGTGESSEAVAGYTDPLFLESGTFFEDSSQYGYSQTGRELVFDNSLNFQNSFATGISIDAGIITGVDFTGSGIFGSGAGSLWAEDCPKYTGYEYSTGDLFYGGYFNYAYFDSENKNFKCVSQKEIESGTYNIDAIYSMPVNEPNSYDIKYRKGPNFSKSYEQASSYLNSIGEMPAVIINNFQLQKIQSMNSGAGWVGLRRNNVGILKDLFSESFTNQGFFAGTDFLQETSRPIEAVNSFGEIEQSEIVVNDVGDYWAWVNNSGTHIYKYAGSGYEKVREASLSIDIKRNRDDQILFSTGHTGTVDPMEFNEVNHSLSERTITFDYNFKNNYYNTGESDNPLYTGNYNVIKVDLFTGDNPNFTADQSSFVQGYHFNYPTTGDGDFDIFGNNNVEANEIDLQESISKDFSEIELSVDYPIYYKILPYDTIGSGIIYQSNALDRPKLEVQSSILNLDSAQESDTNCITHYFNYEHPTPPNVTFGLGYTGTKDSMSYLGAMIKGKPTTSSVDFILTEVPPDTGYCLYIDSSSS